MNEVLIEIIKSGITIEMFYDKKKDCVLYDMNTQAKSHLYLKEEEDGTFTGYGRYDTIYTDLEDIEDITWKVYLGMYGRPYVNNAWYELMKVYVGEEELKRKLVH